MFIDDTESSNYEHCELFIIILSFLNQQSRIMNKGPLTPQMCAWPLSFPGIKTDVYKSETILKQKNLKKFQ